jgi:hypothetical protein
LYPETAATAEKFFLRRIGFDTIPITEFLHFASSFHFVSRFLWPYPAGLTVFTTATIAIRVTIDSGQATEKAEAQPKASTIGQRGATLATRLLYKTNFWCHLVAVKARDLVPEIYQME